MSLGAAFLGFMFLFFLVFCLYFTWNEFFSFNAQKVTAGTGALEDSPEWRAFLNRRQEIENDPTLDELSKKVLIDNWLSMAGESKPHMAVVGGGSALNLSWAKPAALPWLIVVSLSVATLVTYTVGAMNPGALRWPVLNPSSSISNLTTVNPATGADQSVSASAGHPGDGASLEDRLAGLQAKLAEQPDDLRGWVLLGRTHASMSNYVESANALRKALALAPGHPDILADLADMSAMAQGRQLAGEPETYILAALQSDPRHEKALALAASAAEQAGDNDKAQVYWQLLSQVQQESLKNPQPPVENVLTTVSVAIPQAALNGMGENSSLFVFLKAQAGPGMPLAVVRVPSSQLIAGNLAVRIGPGDFIQEGGVDQLPEIVHVQARLSVLGMAQTSAGDIQSASQSIPRSELATGIQLSMPEGSAKQ